MSKLRFDLKARKFRSSLNSLANRIGEIAVDYSKNVVFPSQTFDEKHWSSRKKEYNHPMLQKSGLTRATIHVIRANSKGVKWGSSTKYSGYLNKGTSKMPARQFIGVDRRLRDKIKKEVLLAMRQSLR